VHVTGKEIMATMKPMIYLLENGGKYIQYNETRLRARWRSCGRDAPLMGGLTPEQNANFTKLSKKLRAARIGRSEPGTTAPAAHSIAITVE
jgi:hypothetical protein